MHQPRTLAQQSCCCILKKDSTAANIQWKNIFVIKHRLFNFWSKIANVSGFPLGDISLYIRLFGCTSKYCSVPFPPVISRHCISIPTFLTKRMSRPFVVCFPGQSTRQCAPLVRLSPNSLHKQVVSYMRSDRLQLVWSQPPIPCKCEHWEFSSRSFQTFGNLERNATHRSDRTERTDRQTDRQTGRQEKKDRQEKNMIDS